MENYLNKLLHRVYHCYGIEKLASFLMCKNLEKMFAFHGFIQHCFTPLML